jgi:hypothetical protein
MRNALALLVALWPAALFGASAAAGNKSAAASQETSAAAGQPTSAALAAPDCGAPVAVSAPLDGPLQPMSRVENLRIALQSCSRQGSSAVLAIRTLRVDGEALLLAVDPEKLTTRLERAACWTCTPTTVEAQAHTRLIRSTEDFSTARGKSLPPGSSWLTNAGLTHGQGKGAFLSGDLCPSHRALDRGFLQSLEQGGTATPIALSVSGRWMEQHPQDFFWLRREKAEGRLAISFVNHSFHHYYRPGLPDGQNFLLVPGVDMSSEILDVERLLIANGEVPSVFFRFPGLISDPALMEALLQAHLVPLGAQSWLALAPNATPPEAAVVLVHPNGNEPFGLNVFKTLSASGKLPKPFRAIEDAPP